MKREDALDRALRRYLAGTERHECELPEYIKQRVDLTLSALGETAIRPTKPRLRRARNVAAVLAFGACIGFGLLALAPSSMAESVRPWVHSIFAWIGDDGINSTYAERAAAIAERTDSGYTIRIHEALFDGMRLSFSYSIIHENGIPPQRFVTPDFQIGQALKAYGAQAMKFDYGSAAAEGQAGIVKYFIVGELPDTFELPVTIAQLGISENQAYQVVPGNWNMTIPFQREGSVRVLRTEPTDAYMHDEIRIEVKEVRVSETAVEWKLALNAPERKQPFDRDRTDLDYAFRFFDADGEELTIIGSSESSGRAMRQDGRETVMYTLYTEPPESKEEAVEIMPVRRIREFRDGKLSSTAEEELPPLQVPLTE